MQIKQGVQSSARNEVERGERRLQGSVRKLQGLRDEKSRRRCRWPREGSADGCGTAKAWISSEERIFSSALTILSRAPGS